MKKKLGADFWFKLTSLFFAVLMLIGAFAVFQIRNNGSKCMANPLEYGVKEYSKLNYGDLTCSCNFQDSKIASFIITKEGSKPINLPTYDSKMQEVNLTGLLIKGK